jgi:hypothetical protein
MFLTFGYYAMVTQIMGFFSRYYYPSLPFLIFGAFVAANTYAKERSISRHKEDSLPLLRSVTAMVLLVVLISTPVEGCIKKAWHRLMIKEPTHFTAQRQYTTKASGTLPDLDGWRSIHEIDSLLQHLPQDIVLAASEYGYIGSQHPAIKIIDLVGLHDRNIAHHNFSANYLFSKMPDIIWFPHSDYTYAIKEILDSKAFMDNYDFYPNAYKYGLALLRNSESSENIHRILKKEFSRIYSGHKMSDYRAEPVASPLN